MTEIHIIERLRRKLPVFPRSGIVLSVGDDCAIFRPKGSPEDLLFTTDLLIEDIHFHRTTHTPEDVGHKAVARGLSDIAAMGGEPRFCLLSVALSTGLEGAWMDRFYRGALRLAGIHKLTIAGGDLAHAARFACDVVVCGAVPRGEALTRSGARPGDSIYVSGVLGGSALGLESRSAAARKRHLRPEPRVALGCLLRRKVRTSAAMDLSDGISLDLHRFSVASGVSAVIDHPLPSFPGASVEQVLHGGEDYELLFTVAPGTRVPRHHDGVPLTRIGSIVERRRMRVAFFGRELEPLGYDHFRLAT
ncbi:MAG TPA: thiamine-phosphate kinase [Bryobacteraceae bacterium]|nr:thiamine-phosphate kinase [Bryobacteraceae bacterium]